MAVNLSIYLYSTKSQQSHLKAAWALWCNGSGKTQDLFEYGDILILYISKKRRTWVIFESVHMLKWVSLWDKTGLLSFCSGRLLVKSKGHAKSLWVMKMSSSLGSLNLSKALLKLKKYMFTLCLEMFFFSLAAGS